MSSWLRVATLALVMRAPLVVVAPLVPLIVDSGSVSEQWIGLSVGLSLFCFSVGAAAVPLIGRRLSEQAVIRLCLVLCAAGVLLRKAGGVVSFVAGSLTIGVAIGLLNVVMPGYAAHHGGGQRTRGATAVTFGLNVGAILSVLAVSILAPHITSWRLLACAPLAFLIAAWLLPDIRTGSGDADPEQRTVSLGLRQLSGWRTIALVTLFMGIQASGYYIFLTWMPFALVEDGASHTVAGLVVAANQVGQIAVALVVATGPQVLRRSRTYGPLIIVGALAGTSLLVASPWMMPVIGVIFGASHGAALSMAFHLIADKSTGPSVTTQMSMIAHLLGYAVAGCAPALAGMAVESRHFVELLVAINLVLAVVLTGILAAVGGLPRASAAPAAGTS